MQYIYHKHTKDGRPVHDENIYLNLLQTSSRAGTRRLKQAAAASRWQSWRAGAAAKMHNQAGGGNLGDKDLDDLLGHVCNVHNGDTGDESGQGGGGSDENVESGGENVSCRLQGLWSSQVPSGRRRPRRPQLPTAVTRTPASWCLRPWTLRAGATKMRSITGDGSRRGGGSDDEDAGPGKDPPGPSLWPALRPAPS